jgi:hypothetical protein
MENITLLEANKPEKVQEAVNELLAFKNQGFSGLSKEQIGLENVDNTADINKPLSTPQKTYIDQHDDLHVKKFSATPQTIDSDINLAEDKSLFIERGNGEIPRVLSIENVNGFENVEVGSENIPLRLHHSTKDINETVVGRNPKVEVKDEQGGTTEEKVSFLSDVLSSVQAAKDDLNAKITVAKNEALTAAQNEADRAQSAENEKVDKAVMSGAEVENGVVTNVAGDYYTDVSTDVMNLHITTRSIIDGSIIADVIIPLKLASEISRGLMSTEQVKTLSDLVSRVTSIEGKTSRYIYTASTSPTAEEIDEFVQLQGQSAPYEGVAVVISGTYDIWHYYENDDIGWRDDGSDTVNQASNTSYGIVIGSTAVGKVFIEADGSMSVVGFDALTERITALENSRLNDINISGGTNNGTIKLTKNTNGTNTTTDNIPVTGLGGAAFTNSSAYATSAQGAKADSAYQKPSSGIPNSDLTDAARASLLKADNSVQAVRVNGSEQSKTGGVVDITLSPTVSPEAMEAFVAGAIEAAIGNAIGGDF